MVINCRFTAVTLETPPPGATSPPTSESLSDAKVPVLAV